MRFYKLLIVFAIASFLLTACNTDELQDLNINPQAVTQIDLNFLFTTAELGIASNGSSGDNRYTDWRTNIGFCSMAIQQLANAGGGIAPGDKYTENAETNACIFDFTYNDQLKNIAEILKQTGPGGYDEGAKVNMRNASRILKVFSMLRVTDFYGNVPYAEANKGIEGLFFPAYDQQPAIYADLFKELEEAAGAMNASLPDEGFARADIIFEGDVSKWKKWAYSVMLRMAMRVSNVDQGMANTYVQKAVAGGVMTSNADNVIVRMSLTPSEWTNQNGISRAFYPGDGGQPSYLSETLINWLKGADLNSVADDDPRLMIISGGIADWTAAEWKPTNVNPLEQKGMPNGKDQSQLNVIEGTTVDQAKTYSRINFLMLQDDEPYMIMHAAESHFLLAEAAQRGIGGVTNAKAHYDAGVKAAMQMYTAYDASLTVSDQEVADYLTTYPYDPSKGEQMIGEQLWASLFFNWWEAWTTWRRTGYPILQPTNYPGNLTNGQIPRRLLYPTTEQAANPNFEAGSTKPNDYLTKLWWDVK
jgi:hypothetical protein